MNRPRLAVARAVIGAVAAGVAVTTILSGCAVNELAVTSNSKLSGTIFGDGASSQRAAQDAWIAAFQIAHPRATVEYDPVGSGSGRDAFQAGAIDFTGSDRPFTIEELASGTFASCRSGSPIIELPAYVSPIAIVFHLDGIDRLNLDATTIARIFNGQVQRWDDPEIADQNPGVTLPSILISAVHRSDDSGVTENFTQYLHEAAPNEWSWEPAGTWPIPGGEAAQGTAGVATAVANGHGTIGYVDGSQARGRPSVAVKVEDGYVPYSSAAAAAVVDASPLETGRTAGDLVIAIDRKGAGSGTYPVVLVSYLIGCEHYADPVQGKLVREYFDWIVSDTAQKTAEESAGSAPLPPAFAAQARAVVAGIR
ncbi:phosphate transport system substrate-binding protein [Cryobacterium mesophilum]|uniref:phosphate ABC transporter substrate-binding protein PstS n=1 Tax=Terrimesophilobacter mesophilus TaxID=433647 RepID=UPI0017CBE693|nr:phosphate ABC transporter substrate-binding protein PstS [Terrimesophilobacter mesophilus]MBB5632792.1 phosphate transport system substrate-binding protein [Terrimesophilobacter mesophilus]